MNQNKIERYFENEDRGDRGLYIHIPFCHRKCYYCDFLAYPYQEKRIEAYTQNLLKEIELYRKKYGKLRLNTIFLGGGTPSYLENKHLKRLFDSIYENFTIAEKSEITIETNPEDVCEEKLELYKEVGVNRISLGAQTFDDEILKTLGRNHRSQDTFKAIDLVRKYRFKNLSLDMISSLPGQDISRLKDDLEKLIEINPQHISYYCLILEKSTHLHRLVLENKLEIADEELDRKMYHLIAERLKKENYERYEISNFSKKGYESSHNKKYWLCKECLGLGLGSSGFFKGIRYKNTSSFKDYEKKLLNGDFPIENAEKTTKEAFRTDYIITNMRLSRGVDLKKFEDIFDENLLLTRKKEISSFIKDDLIKVKDDRLFFTEKGIDISNTVLVALI